jgi:hypothetical protein
MPVGVPGKINPVFFPFLLRLLGNDFLYKTVPGITTRTFAQPLGAFITTVLTEKCRLRLAHRVKVVFRGEISWRIKQQQVRKKTNHTEDSNVNE